MWLHNRGKQTPWLSLNAYLTNKGPRIPRINDLFHSESMSSLEGTSDFFEFHQKFVHQLIARFRGFRSAELPFVCCFYSAFEWKTSPIPRWPVEHSIRQAQSGGWAEFKRSYWRGELGWISTYQATRSPRPSSGSPNAPPATPNARRMMIVYIGTVALYNADIAVAPCRMVAAFSAIEPVEGG